MNKPSESALYKYEEIKPPKELSGFINKIWLFNSAAFSDIGKNFRILPDYTSSLIFTSGSSAKRQQVFLVGPNTIPIQIQHFPKQLSCGFRFKPAILHGLLGVTHSISLDKVVPLNEIIDESSYNALVKSFFSTVSIKKKIAVFDSFISGFSNEPNAKQMELYKIIDVMLSSDGSVKLESIYDSLNISIRQFQRNFIAATGLSPKEFCKIVRFHTLANKLVKNNFRHYDALVEMGYYDQSHYYREFKEFTGMLPGAFESRQRRIKHQNLID
jgi:AraC-like DNA-binding protein